jgi:hypothetical protein
LDETLPRLVIYTRGIHQKAGAIGSPPLWLGDQASLDAKRLREREAADVFGRKRCVTAAERARGDDAEQERRRGRGRSTGDQRPEARHDGQ